MSKPAYTFPITKQQAEKLKNFKNDPRVFVIISFEENDVFAVKLILQSELAGKKVKKIGAATQHGIETPIYVIVEEDNCEHVFGTKTINDYLDGTMKAVCMKCSYEP